MTRPRTGREITGRRPLVALIALLLGVLLVAGCSIDGRAIAVGEEDQGGSSSVDSDQYDNVLLECQILNPLTIAKVAGGSFAQGTFSGAICRWVVVGGVESSVTFTWYEWGSLNHEKETAKDLGYVTENIKVASQTAFTQRDPSRAAVCGVTAKAPSRGVFTWWVEPRGGVAAGADACDAPTKLMELVLTGGQ